MRFNEGSYVMVINWGKPQVYKIIMNALKDLISLTGIGSLYYSINFNVVTIDVKGIKRLVVIPPSSIVIRSNDHEDELDEILSTLQLGLNAKILKLREDSWIDCKYLLNNGVNINLNISKVRGEFNEVIDFINYVNTLLGDKACELLGSSCISRFSEYVTDYLLKPHVLAPIDLTNYGGNELDYSPCKDVFPLWVSHPVIYGINFPTVIDHWGGCVVYHVPKNDKFYLLSKPLVLANDSPAILEIPYNKSLVFLSNLISPNILLKSILYTC